MRRLLVLALLFGCSEAPPTSPSTQPLAWGPDDRPEIIAQDLETRFAELPLQGEAEKIPWAGSYWPTYQDSINDRWAGAEALSPAEKFAQAFDRPGLVDNVSRVYGIDSLPAARPCTHDRDCDAAKGEACAKRRGNEEGRCIETWFGVCHAWAPAAILEPEPVRAVVHNGVEFRINDLKALAALSYDEGLEQHIMALRCDKAASAVDYDEWGRPTGGDRACRDTNPGAYHIVITNLLGLRRQAMAEDRTYDYEVWNQPLRGYRVTHNEAVDAAAANALIGADGAEYRFNDAAVAFQHIRMSLQYIFESHQTEDGNNADHIDDYTGTDHYEYVLELDGEGRIIGGEWVGDSKRSHPDFLWAPGAKADTEVARSLVDLGTVAGSATPNQWVKIGRYDVEPGERVHAKMKGDGDGDLYLRFGSRPWKSRYDCRPLLPGSEESCTTDVPAGKERVYVYVNGYTAANFEVTVQVERKGTGILYSEVAELLRRAAEPELPGPPPVEPQSQMESGPIAAKAWAHFGPFTLGSGALTAVMESRMGDPDLYVRAGAQPTDEAFDCRPWLGEGETERCEVTGAEVYASVYGYVDSEYALNLDWTPPRPAEPEPMEPQSAEQSRQASGVAEKDAWTHFGPFQLDGDAPLRAVLSASSGDPDLYLRRGEQPTEAAFDCRPWLEGTASETCEISGAGQIYVSVLGYQRADFSLDLSWFGR